jgi:hypothetical protein
MVRRARFEFKRIRHKLSRKGWEVSEAITVNRNTDGFDWCFNGKEMMHERTMFPWNIFKPMATHYWTAPTFTDRKLAQLAASKYGGEVTEEFYCDSENPAWFISFSDFDKATKFCEEYLTVIGN